MNTVDEFKLGAVAINGRFNEGCTVDIVQKYAKRLSEAKIDRDFQHYLRCILVLCGDHNVTVSID